MKKRPPARGAFSLMIYWTKTLMRGALCRCPKCSKGSIFETFFRVRKTCPGCGVTLQPYLGDSAGVIGLGYCLFVPPGVLLAFLAGYYLKWGPLAVFLTYALSTVAMLFIFFRNLKSTWISIVYLMTGFRKNL